MSMFRHDCTKHGHRFQARYDRWPNGALGISSLKADSLSTRGDLLTEMVTERRYVHDVCVRCGKVVSRIPDV